MPKFTDGRYFARVINQALGEARTGTPQIVIQFLVLGAVTAPGQYEEAPVKESRAMFLPLTEKTAERTCNDLSTLGFTGQKFEQIDPTHPQHVDLTNNEFEAYCKHEEYEGKEREKWSVAIQGGAMPEIKPLDKNKARDLNNLFGKHLKKPSGTKQNATAVAPKQTQQQAAAPPPANRGDAYEPPDYSSVPPPSDKDRW